MYSFANVQVLCILDMYRYLKKLLISNVIILCIFNALYIGIATHTHKQARCFSSSLESKRACGTFRRCEYGVL